MHGSPAGLRGILGGTGNSLDTVDEGMATEAWNRAQQAVPGESSAERFKRVQQEFSKQLPIVQREHGSLAAEFCWPQNGHTCFPASDSSTRPVDGTGVTVGAGPALADARPDALLVPLPLDAWPLDACELVLRMRSDVSAVSLFGSIARLIESVPSACCASAFSRSTKGSVITLTSRPEQKPHLLLRTG